MKYQALLSVCLLSLHAQSLMYSARSLANSSNGNDGAFVQGSVLGGNVYSNGVRFLNTPFDEGNHEVTEYLPDGTLFNNCGWAHGGGLLGGQAIATNSSYLFVGQRIDNGGHSYNALFPGNTTWPPNGHVWYVVSRRDILNCGNGVTFTGAKGGDVTIPAMFLVVDDRTGEASDDAVDPALTARITGLAANNTSLYVASSFSNSVKVYSASTMAPASPASFTLPSSATPGAMAVDGSGNVWVVNKGNHHIYKCVLSGSWTCTDSISISGWNPLSLSISNTGKLMVGDGGPAQQITFWDITGSPSLSSTVGTSGGAYGNTSLTATTLLPPVGIGTDASGNIHIVQGGVGGARILELASDGVTKVNEVYGLTYTDTATCDPADDCVTIHTRQNRFIATYPGGALAWNGVTIDPLTYTTDDRIPLANGDPLVQYLTILKVVNIGGQKLMYATDQYAHRLSIYRWNSGTAKWIPSGMIVPIHNFQYLAGISTAGAFKVWIDGTGGGTVDGIVTSNEVTTLATETQAGWGWDVAANGDVYQTLEGAAGVRKFAYSGLVIGLVPLYTTYSNQGIPAPITKVERAKYDSVNDVMWVCGYTAAHPQLTEADFGLAGTECVKFTTWSTTPVVALRVPLPYDAPNSRYVKSIAVTADYLFAGIMRTTVDEGVHVYSARNGGEVAVLTPLQLGSQILSWIDGTEMLQAYRRANGETILFVEDNFFSHVLMYRFSGNSIATVEPGRQSIVVRARVTDPAQSTITNYTDAARTVKSEDTDNSLFSGSENAVRPFNVTTGNQVAAVIGRRTSETASDGRLHSRSLEVAAPQYTTITDGVTGAQARLTATTLNIPWGDSSPTDCPGSTSDGRLAYPDLFWKDADIARSYIDPCGGLRFRRVARKKSSGQAITDYPFANVFNVSSAWTNQSNILDSSFATHASCTGAGCAPLFLPFDTAGISRFGGNLSIWWGGTFLDDLRVTLNGSAPACTGDDCIVRVCMVTNYAPGGTCSGTPIDVTLPTSTGSRTVPSTFPTMYLDGWGLTKTPNIEEVGVPWGDEEASASSSVVTLADTHGRSFLPLGAANNQKVKFAGNWFTLSNPADSAVFPLQEASVNFTGGAATSHLTADAVSSVTIDTAGAYSIVPLLYFDGPPDVLGKRTATGHATIGGGVLTAVVVDDGGAGYATAPGVHFYIPWQMANFGILITKKTTTGTLNLAASYATALSEATNPPANGVPEYCSRLDFDVTYAADGSTPLSVPYPKGRLCFVGGQSRYLVIALSDGSTRYISKLPHGDSSCTGTGVSIPGNPFSPVDPYSMIVLHRDDSYVTCNAGNLNDVFYKVTYQYANASCRFKDMTGGVYGGGDSGDVCMQFTNQNPGFGHPGATITEQLTTAMAALPSWNDPSLNVRGFGFRLVSGNYGDMQLSVPTAGGSQNNVSFHAIFNMTTFVLTKAYDTFSCTVPDICWSATHSTGYGTGDGTFASDDPKAMDFAQGDGYLAGPMMVEHVTEVSFNNGSTWDPNTQINPGTLISTASCTTQCGTPIAWTVGTQSVDLTRAAGQCPANSFGVPANSYQCIGLHVSSDQPCDFGASPHEVSTWACPWTGSYHFGTSFTSPHGYAAPLFKKLDVGHYVTRATDPTGVLFMDGKSERMRILTKTSDGGTGWYLMLQRWTQNDTPTSDLNAGAAIQFRHLYEGAGGSTYTNGWAAMMAGSPQVWVELGTSAASTHTYKDALPECCGHAGFKLNTARNSISIVASGASRTSIGVGRVGKDFLWDSDTTRWAGFSRDLGGNIIEQYPSGGVWLSILTNEILSMYFDWRHPNPDFGSGGENMGRTFSYSPSLVAGQHFTYLVPIDGAINDQKSWRPNVESSRVGFRDISGPGSAISDATPFTRCMVYVAGQCVGGSLKGQMYVSAPMSHMGWNGCISNSYRAYTPCPSWLWHYTGFWTQGWSERNDATGVFQRRLSMGLVPRFGEYQFTSPHLTPDGNFAFVQPGWPNGVRSDNLLYKIPPPAPVDSGNRSDFVRVPVTLPKGSGFIRIRFGYGPEYGDSTHLFRCTSYGDDCILDSGSDSSIPFVTTYDPGSSPRSDFTGSLGMRFTVGANPITVDALGRVFLTGNSGSHALTLYDYPSGAAVTGGSTTVSFASGNPPNGSFKYASLASPITLSAGTQYYLHSAEVNGTDQWKNEAGLTVNPVASVQNSTYFDTGFHDSFCSGCAFGPVSFTYTPPARVFAYETNDALLGTNCKTGCTLSIPALPGRVLYFRVERSPDGVANWSSGPTQIRQVN